MTRRRLTLAASLLSDAARVAVGILWILEAAVKYSAGFGAADILLVVGSTDDGSRAPIYVAPLRAVMQAVPWLFGIGIPLLELLLGILLIAGFFTRTVAIVSIATLMLYWATDQLIAQYPLMVGFSALVLALPAGALSADAWRSRRRQASPLASEENQP